MSNMLTCALSYAKQGFAVFPCQPHGKKPITEHGFFNATTDIAVITKWWTDEPEANIGMPMGGAKKLLVIDVDPRNGGEESLEKLMAKLGALPKTAEQITGGGGRHIIFHYPGGPVPKELAPGVDLKGDGGYIIVAPSLHPSGRRYQWDGLNGAKALLHPAEVPACYLAITTSANGHGAVFTEKIEKGKQHYALVSLAGTMRKRGCGFEEIFAALIAFNLNRCTEPGPEKNIRKIAEDMCKKAPGQIYQKQAKPPRPAPESFDMETIMETDSIKIPEVLVEGLIPRTGLVLLGGRPKEGKSWFACQLALACVTGQAVGGWLKVFSPCRVQLWALEDGLAITKDKVGKLLRGTSPDGLRDMRLFAELPHPILESGDDDIRAALNAHPSEMFILDSLFKLSGNPNKNYDIGQRDYEIIDRVRKVALEYNCAAVIIMHTKKGAPGGNPIENLLGTTGIPAAADAVAELKRYKAGSGKLTVVGRSVQSDDYELVWNGGPDVWGWGIQAQGDLSDTETNEEVLAYLDAQGDAKPGIIATALHRTFPAVWNSLLRLKERGKVSRMPDKRWTLTKP